MVAFLLPRDQDICSEFRTDGFSSKKEIPENIKQIRVSIGNRIASNLNRAIVRRIFHNDLKYHHYKFQVVQKLEPRYGECEQFSKK